MKFMIAVVGLSTFVVTSCFTAGWVLNGLETDLDRALLRARLAECNYTQHGISDIAWELVRIGRAPVGSAAYYSGLVNSKNSSNALKACMGKYYGR